MQVATTTMYHMARAASVVAVFTMFTCRARTYRIDLTNVQVRKINAADVSHDRVIIYHCLLLLLLLVLYVLPLPWVGSSVVGVTWNIRLTNVITANAQQAAAAAHNRSVWAIKLCLRYSIALSVLTPSGPQSRFGDKLLIL